MSAQLNRPYLYAKIDADSSGANEVVAAVEGKQIIVMNYTMIASAEITATWKSASTAISGPMDLAAKGGASPESGGDSLMATEAGEALNLTLSDAVQVSGHLTYFLR